MGLTQALALIAALGAAVAALGYLGRVFWRAVMGLVHIVQRMLHVADVILGTDEHPSLAARLDGIEHELRTNNGSSLRDVADRVEDLANATRADIRANSAEGKQRREEDRRVIETLVVRIDQLERKTTQGL
jgi:hypothetical protein